MCVSHAVGVPHRGHERATLNEGPHHLEVVGARRVASGQHECLHARLCLCRELVHNRDEDPPAANFGQRGVPVVAVVVEPNVNRVVLRAREM